MRRIYIAGKYTAKDRLLPHALRCLREGHRVLSSWLFAETLEQTASTFQREALRDRQEVQASSLLILDTLDESITGGREVEFGVALAMGIEVWLVGPKRNVFHELADAVFDDWHDCWQKAEL